jgi:hypothetical protein
LDRSGIEKQPEDTLARMALEGEVKRAKLDNVAAVIEAANRVIEATIKQKEPRDDAAMADYDLRSPSKAPR